MIKSHYAETIFIETLKQCNLKELALMKINELFQPESPVELVNLYDLILSQVEIPLIEQALKANNGNQSKTSLMLGINRNTLKMKIDKYQIKPKMYARQLKKIKDSL